MAKKRITDRSTQEEIRTAYEQLRAAENQYTATLSAWPRDSSGHLVDPQTERRLTILDFEAIQRNIALQYDYVDYGVTINPSEISNANTNVTTNSQYVRQIKFFVEGLGADSRVGWDPRAKTTTGASDAYPSAVQKQTLVPNSAGLNPNARRPSQTSITDTTLATESNNVLRDDKDTTSLRLKEMEQAGKSVTDRRNFQTKSIGNGINEDNPNRELVNTNNQNNNPSDFTPQSNQNDDAGKSFSPMGTDFSKMSGITITPDSGRENNGGTTIGTRDSIVAAPEISGTPNKPSVEVRENILHNYVNWTYKIGLYMLSVDEYNVVVTSGKINAGAKQYPIAVSGGYKRQQSGGIDLEGDIYIDRLRFTSVIGNKSEGAATNNFDLEMELVEPYGAGMIGELIIMASQINPKMTLAEIPYMLEIDFTGYEDDGTPVASILGENKKYIPVRIVAMDMKLEAGGSRYVLSMVPYGFYAFTQRYAVIPKDITVSGSTVDDILGEGETGLIGALNAIETENLGKSQEKVDTYKIKFYSFDKSGTANDDMKNAKVAYPQSNGADSSGTATILKNRLFTANDPQKQTYGLKANTIIKEAIKDMVLASEYFPQKMNPSNPGGSKEPAELLKVIPSIEIQKENWDGIRNEYAKTITFHVFNTLMFGENFQNGGNAPIEDWGYNKIYNYIFTGQNTDILSCDINFNLIYYNKTTPDKKETSLILTDALAATDYVPGMIDSNQIANPSTKTTSVMKNSPAENYRYINATLAAEFFDLKMNNSKADMIQLDMTIIGDPDWIPQDASVRGGEIKIANNNTLLDTNNSIAVDVAGVYAKLQFRTPRDYDDATGTMDVAGNKNVVGGVYRVITVENVFESGKFTCNLNMVKIPNQKDNELPSAEFGGPK